MHLYMYIRRRGHVVAAFALIFGLALCVVPCAAAYTLVSGDTCSGIAGQNGLTLDLLISANPGIECDNLQIGSTINLRSRTPTTPTSGSSETRSSGGVSCTASEFSNAVISNNYPALRSEAYDAFNSHTDDGGFSTKRELAMFLAEILWESKGLKYTSEIDPPAGAYVDTSLDKPGEQYYGRGYIQLTHSANYKAASQALFNDDRLLDNPDLVAKNENYAWQVSFWYWKARVGIVPAVKNGQFGAATKAINGAIECSGGDSTIPKNRFDIYVATLTAFGVSESPQEGGCYS